MGPEVDQQPLTISPDTETQAWAGRTSPGDTKQTPVAAPFDWDALLHSLPTYSFRDANPSRRVTYCNSMDASDLAALRFTDCSVIGIDAEWMPTRKRNESNRIALVQVAGRDECQLHHVRGFPFFPPNLREVLENPSILKVGAGIEQDVRKLRFDWGVEVKTYLDLSPLALELDPFWGERAYRRGSMIALVRLAARYLKRSVDKEQQCSNWENCDLTESQRTYAANDGCAVLDIYHTLISIRYGNQSLEELGSVPTTPSSISSTSLPPYEAVPPAGLPSILQQPTPAYTPPRFQVLPSHSAPIPPSQAPSVLTPPPVYGPGPYLASPPLYQSPPPMFQDPRLTQLAQLQTPIPMHTPVYQHQPQSPQMSQIYGWNPTPYMYAPPPPLDPYPLGWVPVTQPPPCAPPPSSLWAPSQYNSVNHYLPWGTFL